MLGFPQYSNLTIGFSDCNYWNTFDVYDLKLGQSPIMQMWKGEITLNTPHTMGNPSLLYFFTHKIKYTVTSVSFRKKKMTVADNFFLISLTPNGLHPLHRGDLLPAVLEPC